MLFALGASRSLAGEAPVDLVRGRSQAELSRSLAETRRTLVPVINEVRVPRRPPPEVNDNTLWGEYTVSGNLRIAGENDPRELETQFTLPQVLTLYSANLSYNFTKNNYGFLELTNVTDEDTRARLFVRDPGVYRVDLLAESSHFFDIPPQDRNRRAHDRGEIEMSHMPLIPVRLYYDLHQVKGQGALGFRSWQSRELRFEVAADLLIADALITVPLRNYNDDNNADNGTDSQGFQVRIGSGLLGQNSSIGIQRFRLHNAASDEVEDVILLEASTLNKNPFGIKRLESRSRYKLELRRDQIPRLGRTKSNSETFSVMTYRRNRRLTFEMGGATRKIHRFKMDRRGILLLADRPLASKGDLHLFSQEDKPLVMEGWTGVSYRGIPRLNVNVRADTASIRRNPRTDFGLDGTLDQFGLYPDTRSGVKVDLVYLPYSPYWGAALKIKTETRENLQRGTVVDDALSSLSGHVSPFPFLTLNGEISATVQNTTTAPIFEGQTDSQSYLLGIHYEASPHTAAFADFTHVVSEGALTARDYLITLGLDATEGILDAATWRLMVSRERLRTQTAGVIPFAENQLILQRRQRF